MDTNLPIGRQFFADRFRELAEQIKTPLAATVAGKVLADNETMAAAGELFIEAVDRGYLSVLPGASQWAAAYRETQAKRAAGEYVSFQNGQCVSHEPKPGVLYSVCPQNLFLEVAGGPAKRTVFNDSGTLLDRGAASPEGLLPNVIRAAFPAGNFPLIADREDERRDFLQAIRRGLSDRCVVACLLLADLLSTAGETPPDVNEGYPICLGQGRYRVGAETICLEQAQADVMDFLVEVRAANLKDLKNASGCANPSAMLTRIKNAQPLLDPHIKLPAGKSRGGYSTTIIDGRPVKQA